MSSSSDLACGTPVHDQAADRYGRVADTTTQPGTVWVRPAAGGREWEARREDLRVVQASEMLSAGLRDSVRAHR